MLVVSLADIDSGSQIFLGIGLLGGLVGLIGLLLAATALLRVAQVKEELRRAQSRERSERAELRADLLRAIAEAQKTSASAVDSAAGLSDQSSRTAASRGDADVPKGLAEGREEAARADVLSTAKPTPIGSAGIESRESAATESDPPGPSEVEASGPRRKAGLTRRDPSHRPAAARLAGQAGSAASGDNAGFERFLGTKMLVWLGGLALALAMGFFVHHAFTNNWVTPEIRLIGGAVFSLLLLGAADHLRAKADSVAQAMSGAGIAGLYAVIYSANHFYGFIGSPLDFLLSLVVTGGAVVLALRHGPFTAVLGMLGGFVMPVLLRTGDPVGGTFFGYLILLQLALVAVGRRRDWRWLSVLSLVFGGLWGGLSALQAFPITARVWPEGLFLGMAAVYVFADWPTQRTAKKPGWVWLGFIGVSVSLLLMLAHVSSGAYEPRGLGMLGLLAAATLLLARLDMRFVRLPWAALAAVGGMLMAYAAWGHRGVSVPEYFVSGFAWTAGAYAAVLVLGAWACAWRSRRSDEWAWFSLGAGVAIFGLVLMGLWDRLVEGFAWWGLAAGASGLYAVMAWPRYVSFKGGGHAGGDDRAVGVWAVGSALFAGACVALAGYDEAPWMRLGWATLALLAWAIFLRLRITALRGVVLVLAALVGFCAIWPGPFFSPVAETPVWNGLLLGYGGSAVLLGVIAWWSHRRRDGELSEVLQGIVLVVVFLAPAVLIRHGWIGEDWEASFALYEAAAHATAWLILGIICLTLGPAWRQRVIAAGGMLYGVAGAMVAVVGSGFILNPLWNYESIGAGLILNGLLFIYLLPAILLVCLNVLLRRDKTPGVDIARLLPGFFGVACLLLFFAWVSLNVRQGFAGPVLHFNASTMTSAEWYAYSVAWVVMGGLLLLLGVVTGRATARWGSLAVMMLAVVKVFVFDAAELRDLYRVLSFLGLGASLIGLGYVYQRFVFKRPETRIDEAMPEPGDAAE